MSTEGAGGIRVGTAEREAAIEALNAHWRAGRLDPAEHEARTTKAFAAVTRADLDALFADLPALGPGPIQDALAPSTGPAPLEPTAVTMPGTRPLSGIRYAASRTRDTIMALTPIGATALFVTGQAPWPVFLAIPAAGIVLYGPGGRNSAEHEEQRAAVQAQRQQARLERRLARSRRRSALPPGSGDQAG